jgi:hypothetical protein
MLLISIWPTVREVRFVFSSHRRIGYELSLRFDSIRTAATLHDGQAMMAKAHHDGQAMLSNFSGK